MTSTRTNASSFTREMLAGFSLANSDSLVAVDGGFVSKFRERGKVALVIGGGSGHYPAFAGVVGQGLATAAVCGDIFASPSSGQVFRVAKAAESGAGVLLSYGNYMGDTLNFSLAQEQLRALGLDVRTVRVTDDISSAPAERASERRGVAGDLVVFKIAGAAADLGYDLDAVERVALEANSRVRTFGVAFSGCTLPGADSPLFSVPAGKMALGLGVHGEPGIGEEDLPTPEGLAKVLVGRLLPEVRAIDSKRITVLLNGLGTMKYEELFAVYGFAAQELQGHGFEIIEPEVGELVTSLDMAGCSLTIASLTPELEELWLRDCNTPAFKKVRVRSEELEVSQSDSMQEQAFSEPANSARYAAQVCRVFDELEALMRAQETRLGDLDTLVGDGDHGIGMARGAAGAARKLSESDVRGVVQGLSIAASGWSESGGGTSGAIWSIFLSAMAASLSTQSTLSAASIADALHYAADQVQEIGGARPGDKTMVDAMVPFVETFSARVQSGDGLSASWVAASAEANAQALATAKLLPRVGRARIHGEKGVGHPDAGAISFALSVEALNAIITELGRD